MYSLIMKDIVLFGIQGSGKWTQAQLLLEKRPAYAYCAMGDIFRAIIWTPNPIGDYVKKTLNEWHLINDHVTISLFHSYFHTLVSWQHMLLDGYPRTRVQIDDMLSFASDNERTMTGVHFVLSKEKAIERLLERWRADDNHEAIEKRIQQFYDETQPIIDYFGKHAELISINADNSVENIHQELMSSLM